jgi:dihydropteroate synthase
MGMSGNIYLRPVGRITSPPGRINAAPDKVVRLGERDDVVFAGLELIQRHAPGLFDRRALTVEEALRVAREPGETGQRCKTLLERFAAARGPIAGIKLDRPRIMGIVNVTPDSFSDGGRLATPEAAIAHGLRLEAEGADILDIGGESSRPGAEPVPLEQELRRVMPVLEGLSGLARARLSVDTRNSEVMRRAALAGAHILNDISALRHDPRSARVVADTRLPVILMHTQGDPRSMQADPRYDNVLLDVFDELEGRVEACVRAGIPRERIIVDPGIGFGKTPAHNLELLAGLSLFHGLGTALMLGVSRKSFIGAVAGAVDPMERLPGSIAAALSGIMLGVHIIRVHDVAPTRQALTIWEAATKGAV